LIIVSAIRFTRSSEPRPRSGLNGLFAPMPSPRRGLRAGGRNDDRSPSREHLFNPHRPLRADGGELRRLFAAGAEIGTGASINTTAVLQKAHRAIFCASAGNLRISPYGALWLSVAPSTHFCVTLPGHPTSPRIHRVDELDFRLSPDAIRSNLPYTEHTVEQSIRLT